MIGRADIKDHRKRPFDQPCISDSPSSSKRSRPSPPAAALLYHLAVSAHIASHVHLQQVFVPSTVSPEAADSPIIYTAEASGSKYHFRHDARAAGKAVGLLLFSLDCLKAALGLQDLSYAERLSFGIEFGLVALELLSVADHDLRGRSRDYQCISANRLKEELQDVLGALSDIANQSSRFDVQRRSISLLRVRLAHAQGLSSFAKRLARTVLRDTPTADHVYRHQLYILLAEITTAPRERCDVLEEMLDETVYPAITQATLAAELAILYQLRDWGSIPPVLERFKNSVSRDATDLGMAMRTQFVLLQCLRAARDGDDNEVRSQLKAAYRLMDEASEHDSLKTLRRNGGVLMAEPGLRIQITPPNISFMLTFLTTVVCKRDFIGNQKTCKTIVYASALEQYAEIARREDMWDAGFCVGQSVRDAFELQNSVQSIRAEVMLEAIVARLFRTEIDEAERTFQAVVNLSQEYHLAGLEPHLLFLRGQRDHLLGRSDSARRSYLACKSCLLPGSELGLLLNICLLGVNGDLVDLEEPARAGLFRSLVGQCKGSSNASIQSMGFFLSSLAETNIAAAKHKITVAYDLASRANNNVLRTLIFAFTTSTHLTGTQDKILKQLETGREIAWLMGGKDRDDGVGQVALGLWFAVKLKGWYRMLGNDAGVERARESARAHKARLENVESMLV